MKRLVLFSSPKGRDFEKVIEAIFPGEIDNKVLAYIPTYKKYLDPVFTQKWQNIATLHNTEFQYVDLLKDETKEEVEKIRNANIIVMTGGNTFWLINRLRETGADKAILEVSQKSDFVISGWSAGAMVLTPTIAIGGLPHRDGSKTPMDENKLSLTDLTGLNLVNFEIFPHYVEEMQKHTLENYKKETENEVKALTDDEYVVIDL